MRVDAAQDPEQGGLTVKSGAGSFVATLREGDKLKAEVLSNDGGVVVMKADGGQTFKARLDLDVVLSPGDIVLLEMVGKSAGIVTLSIREEQPIFMESAVQEESAPGFEDKSLLPYAGKLAELSMPVTEENARMIRELISMNPEIGPDEAAFVVSNKLLGDENLIRAAISMLSGGEKTGDMIEHLLTLLDKGESGNRKSDIGIGFGNADIEQTNYYGAQGEVRLNVGNADIEQIVTRAQGECGIQNAETGICFDNTDIEQSNNITHGAVVNEVPAETDYPESRIPDSEFSLAQRLATIMKEIIPQNNSVMQSSISTNNVEKSDTAVFPGDTYLIEPQNPDIRKADDGDSEARDANYRDTQDETKVRFEIDCKAIAERLSELQEFCGMPSHKLERFAGILLRIAGDNPDVPNAGVEKLADMLNNAFIQIGKNDIDKGEQLRSSKEELFARLTLLEDAVSRAAPPGKALMLEQTRGLMDHVRLLNSINQFVYMQIPIQMGEEKKTADLYVFKKKGSKRLDPEDVNILLALDLENMGHWEGLINIRNRGVSIKMEVRGPVEKAHFSESTVLLHELLAEAGFKLVNTEITYSKGETTPLTAMSLLAKHKSSRTGIDYII